MNILLLAVVVAAVVVGLLVLLYSLCRIAADRLTIDLGEAFGGDDDAQQR